MNSSLALLVVAAVDAGGPHPYVIGAIALGVLMLLLLVTLAFRSVGQRNRNLPPRPHGHAAAHDEIGAAHRAGGHHGDVSHRP